MQEAVKQAIQDEARRLGFILAGVTTPEPPPHWPIFENWLRQGRHASMDYLADDRARARRADPRRILPECKSILVLAFPYSPPSPPDGGRCEEDAGEEMRGEIAAYAWGTDYHLVIPEKLKALVAFIEEQIGHLVPNRWYTDTGPILERDLAQRAGLGWIGKNTCLIHPRRGSYFLLAEILLDLDLEPDPPFVTDHCGTCTLCIEACPTQCILDDRTLDAGRCISYLTIELKEDIPIELRASLEEWVFGCDVCQMVCPWNRFAAEGDAALRPRPELQRPRLIRELTLTTEEFNRKFKDSPIRRAKRRGYLRNIAVALGNAGDRKAIPALERAREDMEPMVQRHAAWALDEISKHGDGQ
jgi:epoxyqueuosine reductase